MQGDMQQQPVQRALQLWPEHKRGMPNALARCALFKVGSHKTKREYRENLSLASTSDMRISFTGYELRQDDADVFLQLIHLQRERSLEEGVEFVSTPLLKVLGRTVNKDYLQKLKKSLTRMVATAITIENKDGSIGYCGPLIQRFAWRDESTGKPLRHWKVWFDPKIASLFDWASYSQVDWKIRLSLGPLAKWLHLYYASHKKPYSIKSETIMLMCGSSMRELKHFRAELKESLLELVKCGFLASAGIDRASDAVHVERANIKLAND